MRVAFSLTGHVAPVEEVGVAHGDVGVVDGASLGPLDLLVDAIVGHVLDIFDADSDGERGQNHGDEQHDEEAQALVLRASEPGDEEGSTCKGAVSYHGRNTKWVAQYHTGITTLSHECCCTWPSP